VRWADYRVIYTIDDAVFVVVSVVALGPPQGGLRTVIDLFARLRFVSGFVLAVPARHRSWRTRGASAVISVEYSTILDGYVIHNVIHCEFIPWRHHSW